MANVFGNDFGETLNAADGVTEGADSIFGYGGNDNIFGLGGNDVIQGGTGADDINGGNGSDFANYIDSAAGVQVSLITDTGTGGSAEGDELVSIENLTGSSHQDLLVGDDNNNVIAGISGNDNLKGGGGADTLYGDSNNDTLKGGGGADILNGGSGIDTAAYNESAAGVNVFLVIDTASGGDAQGDELNSIENLTGSAHNDQLWGHNGVNELRGMNGDDTLKGYGGEDTLLGGSNNDTLYGMDGDDTVDGGTGNDTLDGGAGEDTLIGDLGNDTFIVDSADDVVVELSFEGNDTIMASVDYDMAAGVWVETLRTVDDNDTAAIDLIGNGVGNIIIGNAGANVLDGVGGADTMSGLDGNDIYYVDNADDTVNEAANSGSDSVRASTTYILAAGVSAEALTTTNVAGVNQMTLVGNDFAQTIQGNAAINVLTGQGGNDYLQGLGGNDTLNGGAGADIFLFNTALNVATNVDTINGFTVVDDLIRLDDAIFAAAGAVGALNADAFHIGAAAADAEDRIIYNSASGDLFYDANGTAAGGQILFAELTAGLALTNNDFAIV